MRRFWFVFLALLMGVSSARVAEALEPNDRFEDRTFLEPGTTLVSDDLTAIIGVFPDTLVGARGLFGDIVESNDDGGPYSEFFGSALYDVSILNGEIAFSVSGLNDDNFDGSHNEFGDFEAIVTVYDLFGDQIDRLSFTDTLEPGLTSENSFSDSSYLNGSYDVEINNTVSTSGDVDFFTFTGLTPGDTFMAEVLDPDNFALDSLLSWFDGFGNELDFNDDFETSSNRSALEGIVPSNGEVTLAISADDDINYEGAHAAEWTYELSFLTNGPDLMADANGDGAVDLLDLDILGANFGSSPAALAQGDFNGDNVVDLLDLDILGSEFGAGAATSVPEPTALCLVGMAAAAACQRRR